MAKQRSWLVGRQGRRVASAAVTLVDDGRWARFEAKRLAMEALDSELRSRRREGRPLLDWMRRPHVRLSDLAGGDGGLDLAGVPDEVVQMICAAGTADECRAKVAEYVASGCTAPILYPLGDDVRAMIDAFAVA